MKEIWIIRHGATEWTEKHKHTSVTDLPLTDQGVSQALVLKKYVETLSFDKVFCSPLQRARQTADLCGFHDYEIDEDLFEWRYGSVEGMTTEQIHKKYQKDWNIYTHADVTEGAETVSSVKKRVKRFFSKINFAGYEKVLIVSSAHISRAIAAFWIGESIEIAKHLVLSTASVSILGFEHDYPAILRWNQNYDISC